MTFNNSGQTEDLTDFPVLVSLDNMRIDYNKTQDSGEDLRFVDSDGTLLSHEIEKWDESGISTVWVKIPQIDASSTTDYIWMYYGNPGAGDGQDITNVWNSNYLGVWHLDENSGPYFDSTLNANNGAEQGTVTQVSGGATGPAQDFDAGTDRVYIPVNTGSTLTISTWAKLDTQGDMLWCIDTTSASIGLDLWFQAGNMHLNSWDGSGAGNLFGPQPAGVNLWHQYSTVISPANTEVFVDGATGGTTAYKDPSGTGIYIGSIQTAYTWNGSVDELRISNAARSNDWIKAQFDSMNDTFITYGSEQ